MPHMNGVGSEQSQSLLQVAEYVLETQRSDGKHRALVCQQSTWSG